MSTDEPGVQSVGRCPSLFGCEKGERAEVRVALADHSQCVLDIAPCPGLDGEIHASLWLRLAENFRQFAALVGSSGANPRAV